jgi:hypothetical protein
MSIFSWLLIGHLVGDWLLQNDWMAQGKRRSWRGGPLLVHCAIYAAVITGIGVAFAPQQLEGGNLARLLLVAFGSHWLIDGFDLAAHWSWRMRQSSLPAVRIMNDQTMHVLVLAWMAHWLAAG